jgi:hypothetical protein
MRICDYKFAVHGFFAEHNPVKAPEAQKVILGYLDAFDPDILVQFSKTVPDFVANLGLRVIEPTDIWAGLGQEGNLSSKFGIGIFELLKDIFEEYFRYKPKYPVKVILPKIPGQFSLFWASLFGEIPSIVLDVVEKLYMERLEIEKVDFAPAKLTETLAGNVVFPRRIVERGVNTSNRPRFGRDAAAYFMDATNLEDIVDFWNLRASGRRVLPIPEQLQGDPTQCTGYILERSRKRWEFDCTRERRRGRYRKVVKTKSTPKLTILSGSRSAKFKSCTTHKAVPSPEKRGSRQYEVLLHISEYDFSGK